MSSGLASSLRSLRVINGTDPAANVELAEVVPAGKQWLLRAVSVALVQGITQTPQPILQIRTPLDPVNEVQTITLDAVPTGGTLKLTYTAPEGGPGTTQSTADISGVTGLTAAEIQTALRLLTGLDAVTVTGADNGPFTVTFIGGTVGGRNVPLLTVTDNAITPATNFAIVQTNAGIEGGTVFEGFGASNVQAVSTTCRYNWAPNLPLSAVIGATTNVHATAPLPVDLVLGAGYRISTNTLGKGANTDYGQPTLLVVEAG